MHREDPPPPVPVLEGDGRAGDVAAELDDRAAEPTLGVLHHKIDDSLDHGNRRREVAAPGLGAQHVVAVAVAHADLR